MSRASGTSRAAARTTPFTPTPRGGIRRIELAGACDDRLFFAQVREDPRVEIEALRPGAADRVVCVASGGCTALSLLAAGAGEVHAVDVNRAQNHLVELKAVAVRELERLEAIAFLGGTPMRATRRLAVYRRLRGRLGPGAAAWWDRRGSAIARGVIEAGISEGFIRLVSRLVRRVVHSPRRVERMLACVTLDEQRLLFAREWDTVGWRALFAILLNRWSMSRAYDPRFFERVGRADFAAHFLALANRALTEVPVADNYFLHQMLLGRYPVERADGVPPYLSARGAAAIAARRDGLLLVDGGVTEHLRTLPDRSVHAFALSNIGEWMDEHGIAELFAEVERTAAPGARVVFRNFVGWTELPSSCTRLVEDAELGPRLMRRDRSVVQPRAVVCRVAGA